LKNQVEGIIKKKFRNNMNLLTPEEAESAANKKMENVLGVNYRKLFFVQYLNKVFLDYFSFSNRHSRDS